MGWSTSEWAVKGVKVGGECFIGNGCWFAYPERVVLKGRSRIDPGLHCTAGLEMGENSVVCAGGFVTGGGLLSMGRWAFMGYGSQVHTSTEKYGTSLVNAWWGETECDRGDVRFEDYAGVASNCVVFPGVVLPEGCAVGVGGLVTSSKHLRPWWIHLGQPAKPWKERNREGILAQEKAPGFLRDHR